MKYLLISYSMYTYDEYTTIESIITLPWTLWFS